MATTTNFGWTTPNDTDLVKDGAAAIRTALNGVDTSFVDLKGGTTGQVLAKATNTDLDFSWVAQDDSNAIQNAIVDAKGDLIAASAADTPARLAVGTNGQVLTADSTAGTGLAWTTPSAGALTLISTTSFTTVASISLPADSFTSTYTDYMIMLNLSTSSASQYLQGRMRASGADSTASSYSSGFIVQNLASSALTNDSSGVQNAFTKLAYCYPSAVGYHQLFVRSPKLTRATGYNGSSSAMTTEGFTLAGIFNDTTSFDSMTFFVGGTISGSVSVYGISK
jgi:hypothetical protein